MGVFWYPLLCRSEGGHLASVENLAIQNFLVEQKRIGIWVGAHQQEREEDWKWSDCTPWEWTLWDPYYHQPNYLDSENCVMIWYKDWVVQWNWYDKWHNVQCSSTKSFVCSKRMCEGTATTNTTVNKGKFSNCLPLTLLCLHMKLKKCKRNTEQLQNFFYGLNHLSLYHPFNIWIP